MIAEGVPGKSGNATAFKFDSVDGHYIDVTSTEGHGSHMVICGPHEPLVTPTREPSTSPSLVPTQTPGNPTSAPVTAAPSTSAPTTQHQGRVYNMLHGTSTSTGGGTPGKKNASGKGDRELANIERMRR